MPVTPDDVRHVAALARLALDEGALEAYARQLDAIVAHFEALRAADLGGDGAAGPAPEGVALREDRPDAVPLARAREAFAPAMRDGFFLVPRLASHGEDAPDGDAAGEGSA